MPTSPAADRPRTPAADPSSNGAPAPILLELVDETGVTIGTAEKLSAHLPPGRLHRAFSVFLFDGEEGCCCSAGRRGSTTPPACGRTPAAVTPIRANRPSSPPRAARVRSSVWRPR